MKTYIIAIGLCGLLFSGCGRKSISSIVSTPITAFTTQVRHNDLAVHARMCTHEEVVKYFNRPEDFYHYYHLLQLRLINTGYVRYTLHAEDCSFFVPPAQLLRPYTTYHSNGGGLFLAFLNAVLLLPVYAISMLKSAVETPPYLAYPDLVVPRSFGLLTGLYAAAVLLPVILGSMWERSRSSYAFREADCYIMMQQQQYSCEPFSTSDLLIMTPRAGFHTPCSIALFNHKTHMMEKVSLLLNPIW